MTGHPGASPPPDLASPVLVIGAGMVGGSVAMALQQAGATVHVRDVDTATAHVAASRGGGTDAPLAGEPEIVVVATPPDHLGAEIVAALAAHPAAVVTDVGSVKAKPLAEAAAAGADLARYVGGHPMAGSERSGPLAAAADLFVGRTWAVVPRADTRPEAVAAVEALARACGATPVRMGAAEHDEAVARVSHLPHLLAALAAGQLRAAPPEHLALSGQGVRDVTRIAAGDPRLWRQIVTANADALTALLSAVRADIDGLLASLEGADQAGVEQVLRAGVAGTAAIPGKHGGPAQRLAPVTVHIPDEPGALARLFADAGEAAVNVEDLRMDHDPARRYGVVEIDVAADRADDLVEALSRRGWSAHR